jgi:hypothetical protein
MTSEKMKLEKINIWAIILGLVIILQLYFQPTEKKFQDFQGPYQFPRTFQDFQGPWGPWLAFLPDSGAALKLLASLPDSRGGQPNIESRLANCFRSRQNMNLDRKKKNIFE